jgi:putative transposase
MILTYRYRVKSNTGFLNKKARAVNYVWNYCNETQRKAVKDGRKWLSGYDLLRLTSGAYKELEISSGTINQVCLRHYKSRTESKSAWLRFRGRKSLGWIPFRAENIRSYGDEFVFLKMKFKVFNSRRIPAGAKICDGGSFAQDSRGRWYLNIYIEVPEAPLKAATRSVGIDLGIKDFAVLSSGERIEAKHFFRKTEDRLAQVQRGGKRRLAKRIHAKIANQRKDFLHKETTKLVNKFDAIFVGDVNSAGLAKTKMAKSVLDASWSTFRTLLAYKSIRNGVTYREVSERFTTQTCSQCGSIGGPKGQIGLNERMWSCSCGAVHDRDVNAALNILRLGKQAPVQGVCA